MTERADPFTAMAAKIELNAESGFGGAFVIMPPGDDAEPIALLMLDDGANPAMFWANVSTAAQLALQRLKDAEEQPGFGGMGRHR